MCGNPTVDTDGGLALNSLIGKGVAHISIFFQNYFTCITNTFFNYSFIFFEYLFISYTSYHKKCYNNYFK